MAPAVVRRADARLQAFGIASPFGTEWLGSAAPDTVREALGIFDRAGLLEDGAEWTLAAGAARQAAGAASVVCGAAVSILTTAVRVGSATLP